MNDKIKPFEEKMQKSYNNLLDEFGSIRAGRANPHVLDQLRVDYYGAPTPIQSVANVSVPEARMIQIQPWEGAKVAVRNIRRDANDSMKKLGKSGDVSEDEIKDLESQVQKVTDKYIAEIDKAVAEKTKEIMTV